MLKLFYRDIDISLPIMDLSKDFDRAFHSGDVEFDFNGHHKNRKTKPVKPKGYNGEFRQDFGYEESIIDDIHINSFLFVSNKESGQRAKDLLLNPKENEWILLNDVHKFGYCLECGKNLEYKFNGKTIKVVEPCEYPNGSLPISFNINVPSGIMVFANYFDNVDTFDINESYRLGLHGAAEHKMELEHYAKQNIAQVFCGNSCPGVYLDGNKLLVGNPGYEENEGGEEIVHELPGTEIGSICTDLWAWSMTCMDTYNKLECDNQEFHINVKPGKYRVTQYWYSKGGYGDGSEPDIFAEINFIGDE